MLKKEKKSSIFLLQISVWFLNLLSVFPQIPLGSRLYVDDKNQWCSSNGDFTIGFFNRFNEYGLGIRMSPGSIPLEKQPVVWVAGADLRVGDKSYFELTKNGELVLFDSTRGAVVWASKTTNSSVSSAFLRDDGNFVLFDEGKNVIWQSFDTPYDTLLPGQNLSAVRVLRAASRNSISSFYSLRMDGSSGLELKWENDVVYWTSGAAGSNRGLRAVVGSDGTVRVFDQGSNPVWSVFGEDHGDSEVKYRVLRLGVDGNLRLYSWLSRLNSWRTVWQAVANQCDVFATCGVSGICAFNETGSPVCQCPFSLTPVSSSKCLTPYQSNCKSGSSMVTYDHTSLYAIYPPNETVVSRASSGQCKSLCEKDRFCTAATFVNDGTAECRTTRTQYVSGHRGLSVTAVSFVKRCSDPIAVMPNLPKSNTTRNTGINKDSGKKICVSCVFGVGGGTVIAFVVIHLAITGFWIYKRRKHLATKASSSHKRECPNPSGVRSLSYDEIKDLTENFKHRIGTNTFKGTFADNQPVVVKDMSVLADAKKFRRIVLRLASIHHKNLVRLEAFCCESSYRFMVYEFVENGSLKKLLEDPEALKMLTWRKRVHTCISVGRAISYLHMGCREFVGHGNLSCKNVVFDENFEAKVNDFGIGSFRDNKFGSERDVNDFGYVVLALVSGDLKRNGGFDWAYEKWTGGRGDEVVDPRIDGGVDVDELERVLRIVFWCFQADERMRPSMGEVVNVLEGVMAVDPPPDPFACRKRLEEEVESGSESDV